MSDAIYSFVFDLDSVEQVFRQVGVRNLVLAVLAGIVPEEAWEGCLVYEGESPIEEGRTACLGQRGAAADTVQQRLVEAFERLGIKVLQVYEGGPEVREPIAKASGGAWFEG
jgi:hypothetical protein